MPDSPTHTHRILVPGLPGRVAVHRPLDPVPGLPGRYVIPAPPSLPPVFTVLEDPAGSGLYTFTGLTEDPPGSGLYAVPAGLPETEPGLYEIGA